MLVLPLKTFRTCANPNCKPGALKRSPPAPPCRWVWSPCLRGWVRERLLPGPAVYVDSRPMPMRPTFLRFPVKNS